MNICLVISSLKAGGAERYMSRLANYWVSKGHNVTLITFDDPKSVPFYPLNSEINLKQLGLLTETTGIFGRVKGIFKRLYLLRKTIKNLSPNVVISFVDITNITTLIATRVLDLKVIVSERTTPQHYFIGPLYTFLRHLFYPLAHKVIVQTKMASNYFCLQNIQIIPNAVPSSLLTKSQNKNDIRKLCSAGRLIQSKGFDTLLRAFCEVLKLYPYLTLTLYGNGPERESLLSLCHSLGIEKNVLFAGTTETILEKLCKQDLFIFPSRFEGFPNALCEAMSVGLPVIASNCSGNVDIIQDQVDGLLFPVDDEQALKKAIITLLEDPTLKNKLSKEALKISNRFNEELILALWDDML